MKVRSLVWIYPVMVLALILSACQPSAETATVVPTALEEAAPAEEAGPVETSENESGEPPVGGTLNFGMTFDTDSLDPLFTWSGLVHKPLFGSLLFYDVDTKEFFPYLAESVTSSEDGLTYTVKFKEGITFHDGSPLTAEDYVFTLNRATQSGGAASTMITGFNSAEAADDLTVIISLSAPSPSFMLSLSSVFLAPLPKAYIESVGDEGFANRPIGAGPYMFDDRVTGEKLTLVRNPDFNWGPSFSHGAPPYIETLEFITIPEYATLAAGLEAGELDITLLESQDVERLGGLENIGLHQFVEPGTGFFLLMNIEKTPFDNLAFRQAINHLINRDAMLQVVNNGYSQPVFGPLDASVTGALSREETQEIGYTFDLETADALMVEAGYEKGVDGFYEKDGTPLQITLINHFTSEDNAAQVIQEQFKQFGIQLEIQSLEFGVSSQLVGEGSFDMALWNWTWPEPSLLFLTYHSSTIGGGGLNLGRVSDPELDELLIEGYTAANMDVAAPFYQDAQRLIIEKAYTIPLYVPNLFMGVNKRLIGAKFAQAAFDWSVFDAYIETNP